MESEVLTVAAREIGYHEGRNHHNKFGEWFGMDNCAWCVIFAAAWCYYYAGVVGDVVGRKYAEGGLYSCSQTLNWYKDHQPDCITDNPIRGSLVIFDFPNTKYSTDHMGLYVSSTRSTITTIDGNTTCGTGNDSNGGWVQQRTRMLKNANPIFITPRELEEEMDIDKLIAAMTDEQAYKIYCKAERHMGTLPLPTSWDAAGELREAKTLGITDGSNPMIPAKRYEAAIMCKRAVTNV